jgi:CheY-like chemotaxis protein
LERERKKMPTILLVEDDAPLRTMLRLTLIYSGYEVLEAGSTDEVATLCGQKRPDLVITDLAMPVSEALEVTVKLRRGNRRTRILALSSGGPMAAESNPDIAHKLGPYHTLTKPFSTAEFLEAVRQALESEA